MKMHSRLLRPLIALPCLAAGLLAAPPDKADSNLLKIPHPAIGSWFGKADQICASAATCQNVALFMTPTLTQDYEFLGNDSLALGGPPFGPHTTAHGRWIPTSSNGIVADYVFMLPGSDKPPTITVLRFRWQAAVVDFDTMQGFVNIFFGPPVPVVWDNLTSAEFPPIPNEAAPALSAPVNFYSDPAQCSSGPPACPLIFKFTVKRVQP
jgi:hypothetical protein